MRFRNLLLTASLLASTCIPATKASALPAGWYATDIGTLSLPGESQEVNGTFTIKSVGELWSSSDKCHYVFTPATGNFSIKVRAVSVDPTYWGWARSGLLVRDSVSPGAQYAFLGLTAYNGTHFLSSDPGQGVSYGGGTGPCWLEIERDGNTFIGRVASDAGGIPGTWVEVGRRTVNMPNAVFVGLAGTSNDDAVRNTSVFDNVQTLGAIGGITGEAWTGIDVGNTGTAGSFTRPDGAFLIKGAGIGTALGSSSTWYENKFHYVYLPMSGNGTGNGSIKARIVSQQNTHSQAIAGLIMRDNLSPDANNVLLGREAGGPVKFQTHQKGADWGSTSTVSGPALPFWLKLERENGVVKGYYSPTGEEGTWTLTGSTTMTMPNNIYVGMLVSSGSNGVLNESKFEQVTTAGTSPLTTDWQHVDLGTVGIPGSARQTISPYQSIVVRGSGAGFFGNSDNGQFVYQAGTGDLQIVARIASHDGPGMTAPAGLMIRDSLNSASKNAMISLSSDGALTFQSHSDVSGTTSSSVVTNGAGAPYWIKLVRSGSTVTGYHSPDGWNWVSAGSATVALNNMAYVGLAVSSKNNGQLGVAEFDQVSVGAIADIPSGTTTVLQDITAGLTLVDEIDTGTVAPVYSSTTNISVTGTILGRTARLMPNNDARGDTAGTIGYVIGQGKGLVAGKAYVLAIEYPDDVSRSMYVINRGADYLRGWATGKANGDARQQFAEPSLESLNYPQTGQWQTYKQFFYLLEKFQGVVGLRDPAAGYRPYTPADGFYVVISRMKKLNDPRSEGAAIGKIRLYEVSDPKALYAPIHYPPPDLPRRAIFWREEMADSLLQTTDPSIQAVSNPVDWYVAKMRMAKILGINTFSKDLLEFGYNQGWETGDEMWTSEAHPPLRDLWTRLVPVATREGFEVMPYFEYKTGISVYDELGLAQQRRAHKLYHDIYPVCSNYHYYQCIWWTEIHNGDLTDPDTLADAKRMLDRTVGDFKARAKFHGVWFRMRDNHLPMSFADSTIARYNADHSGQPAVTANDIRVSYGTSVPTLYNNYVEWWFTKRAAFLTALRDYLRVHGIANAQVLFTPWTSEATPTIHHKGQYGGHAGVVTDDPDWWWSYTGSMQPGWWKYNLEPTAYSQVVSEDLYGDILKENRPITSGSGYEEVFHGSPNADPQNYSSVDGVMMTYPIGRLYALENQSLFESYRCASGLTAIRHFPLNEDNAHDGPTENPSPFDGQLGYLSVDCDRAGNHVMLNNARAVALGDPTNFGYLSGSSFSTGFPEIMRRFNQAYLALPALPSVRQNSASTDSEVVVRRITTSNHGTYYYVVNTSMNKKTNVQVTLSGTGPVTNLVTNTPESGSTLTLTLDSAELRAYRVGP